MKKLLIIPLFLSITNFTNAATNNDTATRGDIEIIKSSENIRVLSNEIMKDYILSYLGKNTSEDISVSISNISKELRSISKHTNKESTKALIDFLTYNKSELKKVIKSKPSEEDIYELIDYVESFIEGSKSIFKGHKYSFSENEKMLMKSKDMSALLDEIYIYYFISRLNTESNHYSKKLNSSINKYSLELSDISKFNYPDELKQVVGSLDNQWNANKIILSDKKDISIPLILNDLNEYESTEIQKLTDFHNKN